MKALSSAREQRHQTVAALSADIQAYQNDFAKGAERAGLARQLVLLVKRHKGIFSTAAALSLRKDRPARPPGTLAPGTMKADWVVSAVKVWRLDR